MDSQQMICRNVLRLVLGFVHCISHPNDTFFILVPDNPFALESFENRYWNLFVHDSSPVHPAAAFILTNYRAMCWVHEKLRPSFPGISDEVAARRDLFVDYVTTTCRPRVQAHLSHVEIPSAT